MGRWTQYDEDDYRLPEGMKRVGYDADTQRYTFQKGDELWLGEPGAEFGGALTRVGTAPGYAGETEDVEGTYLTSRRSDGYQLLSQDHGARPVHSNRGAYRMLFPFLILVGVFLLFIWRLIAGHAPRVAGPHHCPTANSTYRVEPGDSCWGIAQAHGTTVKMLENQTLNPGLDCSKLRPGDVLCLPLVE